MLSGTQSMLLSRIAVEQNGGAKYEESFLQEVIDHWPNVVPIRDFYSNVEGLYSLGREVPVNIGDSEGYIDNLLVTNDGHLVVVETKLWRNPEAVRKVIAQTLQYGMAISELSWEQFESCLRRSDPKGHRLGKDESVFEYVKNSDLAGLDEDFEDNFDKWRRDGEVLLLIVADGIRPSVERLVNWMNTTVGTRPYQFGLVELCMYDLPDGGQFIVPRSLLRIRDGSRHVVTVNIRGAENEAKNVTATVAGPDSVTKAQPQSKMTEEVLEKQIKASNPPEIAALANTLRAKLNASGLGTRALPSCIKYGVNVNGDFIPLMALEAKNLWVQIPMKAVHALGDERFVVCKRKINSVANFYRPGDVDDPTKTNALAPKYGVLKDNVQPFMEAIADVAEIVRTAVAGAL